MRRPLRVLLSLLLLPALVAACSGDDGGTSAEPDPGTSTTALPTEIPTGTVLRVGDQLDYLKTILRLGAEDQDLPYAIEYSAFIGGPPMLQAFQAGALDAGFVGSTPLIFAQAARQDLVAVAGWATESGGYDLVTAPGVEGLDGWADLEGRSVAFQQGTAGQAALLQALAAAGLDYGDITPVFLPTTQIASALQGGSADAGVLVEPLSSVYLAANPTATLADRATEITDRSSFLIASGPALADPAKTAALGDLIGRLARSFAKIAEDPSVLADAVYVQTYKLPPDLAAKIVERNGGVAFIDLDGDIREAQQTLADLFVEAGELPAPVDVDAEFDGRFAGVVAAAGIGSP